MEYMSAITDREVEQFEFLQYNIDHVAIVRSHFQGQDVLVIADIVEEDDYVDIFPMWMLITPEIMAKLESPAEIIANG